MGTPSSLKVFLSSQLNQKTKAVTMPKGSGLTKPMKLSADLADIVGKKEASRAECIKQLWAYLKKNNLQDPRTNNSSSPTKRWLRSLVLTRSVLSVWPSSFLPICLNSFL